MKLKFFIEFNVVLGKVGVKRARPFFSPNARKVATYFLSFWHRTSCRNNWTHRIEPRILAKRND